MGAIAVSVSLLHPFDTLPLHLCTCSWSIVVMHPFRILTSSHQQTATEAKAKALELLDAQVAVHSNQFFVHDSQYGLIIRPQTYSRICQTISPSVHQTITILAREDLLIDKS